MGTETSGDTVTRIAVSPARLRELTEDWQEALDRIVLLVTDMNAIVEELDEIRRFAEPFEVASTDAGD